MFNFFVEHEILPIPNNYAKWLFVFCYVVEKIQVSLYNNHGRFK